MDKKVEVLVATINQYDSSLSQKMNIQTDCIIANQGINESYLEEKHLNHTIKMINTMDCGVGKNRNLALMRSTADICIIADDDLVFLNGYEKIVIDAYEKYTADILIFNLFEKKPKRSITKKAFKVTKYNCGKYGAARLTFLREKIALHGLFFNTSFGGGCKYLSGEDTLFLNDCLKKGLKIMAVPYTLAELTDERPSTWFEGYNEKYFIDKGVLYYVKSRFFCKLNALYFAIRYRKKFRLKFSWRKAYIIMKRGIKDAKKTVNSHRR